jgi:hypothetical protein
MCDKFGDGRMIELSQETRFALEGVERLRIGGERER